MRFRTVVRLSALVQLMAVPLMLNVPLAAIPPPTFKPAELSGLLTWASPSSWLLAMVYGPLPVCAAPARCSEVSRLLVSPAPPSCIGVLEVRLTPLAPRLSVTAPPVAVEIFDWSEDQV